MTGVSNALPGNALQTPAPSVSFHIAESAGIIMVFAAEKIPCKIAQSPRVLVQQRNTKGKEIAGLIISSNRNVS